MTPTSGGGKRCRKEGHSHPSRSTGRAENTDCAQNRGGPVKMGQEKLTGAASPPERPFCHCDACSRAIYKSLYSSFVALAPCGHRTCCHCALAALAKCCSQQMCCPCEDCGLEVDLHQVLGVKLGRDDRLVLDNESEEPVEHEYQQPELLKHKDPYQFFLSQMKDQFTEEGHVVLYACHICRDDSGRLKRGSFTTIFPARTTELESDMAREVCLFAKFLYPILMGPSKKASDHEVPVLMPRELLMFALQDRRILTRFVYALATGVMDINMDLLVNKPDHQSQFLACFVAAEMMVRCKLKKRDISRQR